MRRFENRIHVNWMMEKFAEFNISAFFRTVDLLIKHVNIALANSITLFDDKDIFANISTSLKSEANVIYDKLYAIIFKNN
ncbi:MAG: hypothetical protein WAR79_10825 [Melioribacteraceae bacterium]